MTDIRYTLTRDPDALRQITTADWEVKKQLFRKELAVYGSLALISVGLVLVNIFFLPLRLPIYAFSAVFAFIAYPVAHTLYLWADYAAEQRTFREEVDSYAAQPAIEPDILIFNDYQLTLKQPGELACTTPWPCFDKITLTQQSIRFANADLSHSYIFTRGSLSDEQGRTLLRCAVFHQTDL